MKFVKSKFFVVCVIIAVILVLVPSVLATFGQVDLIRSGLKTIAKPFEWCGSRFAAAVDGFVAVFTDYDDLVKENEALKTEIEALKDQAADNSVLQQENAWLKEYLELHNDNPGFVLADADIISFEAGNYSTVLTLNKGSVHGIKKNMPVITSHGLLGHVTEAGLDWCKVVSIVETSSTVGVYTDRTGVIGTIEGDLALRQQGKCLMSYSADADIKPGDRVYTSGTGSVYPNGLFIGRIISVEPDEVTRRLLAVVEPSIDFSSLEKLGSVMIIRGYVGEVQE
jgi:rod shape-determining protein MreC